MKECGFSEERHTERKLVLLIASCAGRIVIARGIDRH